MIDEETKDYEKEFEKVRKNNRAITALFKKDLAGLSDKTTKAHLDNVSLFLEDFFYREGIENVREGAEYIALFFSFFINKCAWSSPQSVKALASSMKKFYLSMEKSGIVDKERCDFVLDTIAVNLDEWMDKSDISSSRDVYEDYKRNRINCILSYFMDYLKERDMEEDIWNAALKYLNFVILDSSFSLSEGPSPLSIYFRNEFSASGCNLPALKKMANSLGIFYLFLFDAGIISMGRYYEENAIIEDYKALIKRKL